MQKRKGDMYVHTLFGMIDSAVGLYFHVSWLYLLRLRTNLFYAYVYVICRM